jgi:hypothetical protein
VLVVLLVATSAYALQSVVGPWRDSAPRRATLGAPPSSWQKASPGRRPGEATREEEPPAATASFSTADELAVALDAHESQLAQLRAVAEHTVTEPEALAITAAPSTHDTADTMALTAEALTAARAAHDGALTILQGAAEGPQTDIVPREESIRAERAIVDTPSPTQEELAAQHEHLLALEVLDTVAEQAPIQPSSSTEDLLPVPDDSPSTEEQLAEALTEHEATLEGLTDR